MKSEIKFNLKKIKGKFFFKNNKVCRIAIIFIAIFALSAFTASILISCSAVSTGTKETIQKGIKVEVEIKEGMSLTQIANLLQEKGIIDDAFYFKLYVQQQDKEKSLLPGKFMLITGSDYDSVLKSITSSTTASVVYKLAIPEGYTITQTLDKISKDIPFIERSDLDSAARVENYSYEFLKDKTSLEGFLFPKTYDVTTNYTAKNIIEMLLAQYQLETGTLDYTNATNNNYSPYDILIIASMIEREAYVPEERPLISSVINNRLKINMLLQIDATVRYALNKWDGIVTNKDLETDSPYNTYKYAGLTPTPICSPGLASIEAAINPANVDYLYYVVTDEVKHTHSFSKTLEGQQQNQTNASS
ncbi:MAG: endolytic transglycosylase MltG [Actinobacteria bacterium]|nr:endolytic transglycosylase MltG [Actinomycetota bacterium]